MGVDVGNVLLSRRDCVVAPNVATHVVGGDRESNVIGIHDDPYARGLEGNPKLWQEHAWCGGVLKVS